MTKLTKNSGNEQGFSRVERFLSLSEGQFWKAKKDFADRKISEGEILLIAQVDYVDDAPHTIFVRLHPSKIFDLGMSRNVPFLVEEFTDSFEFVEQEIAEASRQKEVKALQDRLQEEQAEMQNAYADPKLMDALIEQELPSKEVEGKTNLPVKSHLLDADIVGAVKTQKITSLMSTGLSEEGVEQIKSGLEDQKTIAERRTEWIALRTKRFSKISSKMSVYFEEKAAVPMAMAQKMKSHIDDLTKGIVSLNLYILKDVDIYTIREGKSAQESERLTVTQKVLYMDEELAVWADVDESFDYNNKKVFFDNLASNNKLVEQIFPTERCVVSVATTRRMIDYVGTDIYERSLKEQANLRRFLLVRDGENIHIVASPEIFHSGLKTTFPSASETEGVFKGFDGRKVTYRDLDYTRKLKMHEAIAVGYKRLLILLCGLDHNKQLFGKFYDEEPSLRFVSQEFQEQYFRFIHDDDGENMLPTYRPESLRKWTDQLNSEITFGSRVLFYWHDVATAESCPSAYTKPSAYMDGVSMQYRPKSEFVYGVVKKRGSRMIMQVEVTGYREGDGEERTFNAVLDLTTGLREVRGSSIICLDRFNVEDALWYLHDRASRKLDIRGIRMLKMAINKANELRNEESLVRKEVRDAALASGHFDDEQVLDRVIDKAIGKWRCANPRKDMEHLGENKKALNNLCDQVYMLAGKGRDPKSDIIQSESDKGRRVLRISLLHNGNYAAYSTVLDSERDDRIQPFTWCARTVYRLQKNSVKSATNTFVNLRSYNNAETILFESDEVESATKKAPSSFETPMEKARFFDDVGASFAQMKELIRIKKEGDVEAIQALIDQYDVERMAMSGTYVVEPYYQLMIGAVQRKGKIKAFGFNVRMFKLVAWLAAGFSELEDDLILAYSSYYKNSSRQKSEIKEVIESLKDKSLIDILSWVSKRNVSLNVTDPSKEEGVEDIAHVMGYSYSFSKAVRAHADEGSDLWFAGESLETIDEFLGIVPPKNASPVIVGLKKDSLNEKAYVFSYSEKELPKILGFIRGLGNGYSACIYDSIEGFEEAYAVKVRTVFNEKGHLIEKATLRKIPTEQVGGEETIATFVWDKVQRQTND